MFMTKKLTGHECQVRTVHAFYSLVKVWTYKDEIKIQYMGSKTGNKVDRIELNKLVKCTDRIPYSQVLEIKELV